MASYRSQLIFIIILLMHSTLGKITPIGIEADYCEAIRMCKSRGGSLVTSENRATLLNLIPRDTTMLQASWISSSDGAEENACMEKSLESETDEHDDCEGQAVIITENPNIIPSPAINCDSSFGAFEYLGARAIVCQDDAGTLSPVQLGTGTGHAYGSFCAALKSCQNVSQKLPKLEDDSSKLLAIRKSLEIGAGYGFWTVSSESGAGDINSYCSGSSSNRNSACPGAMFISRDASSRDISVSRSLLGCDRKLPVYCDVPDDDVISGEGTETPPRDNGTLPVGEEKKGGVSIAVIAGAAAGGAVVVIIIIAVVVVIVVRKKQKSKKPEDPTVPVPGMTHLPKHDVIRSTVDNFDLINDAINQNAAMKTLDPKMTLGSQVSGHSDSKVNLDPASLNRPRLPPPDVSNDYSTSSSVETGNDVKVTNLDTGTTEMTQSQYENIGELTRETNVDSGYSTATVVGNDCGHYDVIGDLATSRTPQPSQSDGPVYAIPHKHLSSETGHVNNDVTKRESYDADPDDVTIVDNALYVSEKL